MGSVLEDYNKEVVKRAAYSFFSRRSNSALPWGILTGIRPAKIAYRLLTETNSRQESYEILMDDYLVYPEKAELVLDVAVNEHHVMNGLDLAAGYSVYVYLPLWEHLPDGEPRVFEDPDNPGQYR